MKKGNQQAIGEKDVALALLIGDLQNRDTIVKTPLSILGHVK